MQTHLEEQTTKEYYKARQNLVEQDGWRDLVKELTNLKEIYNKLDSIESERDLWFAKGQVSILRQMIALEEATKLAVEELDI
jgi:hypothetical protein|tara:strand:+ start:2162 stop:2407 length:246 start_codon:yes stop_codon:yes gene_type:complete